MNRHIAALHARQSAGEKLDFLFFWGHKGQGVGPWILSQWWPARFQVASIEYATAEHWMMAQKARLFDDNEAFNAVLSADTPGKAKAIGRRVRGFDDETWNDHRFAIVRTGNVEKFKQNPDLLRWLLQTDERILVEASPVDSVWGIGIAKDAAGIDEVHNWKGQNLLGFALGEARDRLRRFPAPQLAKAAVELPWVAHPEIPRGSIGWRMGYGEAHMDEFIGFWQAISPDERIQYEMIYPECGPWLGWYEPFGE